MLPQTGLAKVVGYQRRYGLIPWPLKPVGFLSPSSQNWPVSEGWFLHMLLDTNLLSTYCMSLLGGAASVCHDRYDNILQARNKPGMPHLKSFGSILLMLLHLVSSKLNVKFIWQNWVLFFWEHWESTHMRERLCNRNGNSFWLLITRQLW